jgi:hypothetical protein
MDDWNIQLTPGDFRVRKFQTRVRIGSQLKSRATILVYQFRSR